MTGADGAWRQERPKTTRECRGGPPPAAAAHSSSVCSTAHDPRPQTTPCFTSQQQNISASCAVKKVATLLHALPARRRSASSSFEGANRLKAPSSGGISPYLRAGGGGPRTVNKCAQLTVASEHGGENAAIQAQRVRQCCQEGGLCTQSEKLAPGASSRTAWACARGAPPEGRRSALRAPPPPSPQRPPSGARRDAA